MNLTPLEDNLIVEIIEPEAKIGSIIIPDSALEQSSLVKIITPNTVSYNRDGSPRATTLKAGMVCRIPKGKVGTGIPEAPAGKEWLAIPEDCIYYIVET